ncbi:unnamed protein product [Rotaria sp. Silwood1]|nr:unnamed protein product [Rotaria sp. Silwood1]CAF4694736.1 unnamed protein product [Rotaria sp. Silwood1]
MNLEDIDQIQSNGSTALHAACYFNHLEIVRRLLEAGASRAIKNKIPGNNRFIGASGKIEWIIVTPYVKETARAERHSLMFYANHSLEELVQRATKFYLSTQLSSVDKIDQVKYFFQQAIEKGDAEYIVKAYTAETGFYSRLNRDLAGGAETGKHERQFIVDMNSSLSKNISSRIQSYKHHGKDPDELRRRRNQYNISLRKTKRDEQIQCKRNLIVNESMSDETDDDDELRRCLNLNEILLQSQNSDLSICYEGIRSARKLLSIERNPPIDELINLNFLPILVQCLSYDQYPDLQFEAAWALTNIASGNTHQTQAVVNADALPYLLRLLHSTYSNVCEQAVWAIGNLIGDGSRLRDYAIELGVISPLIEFIQKDIPITFLRNVTWVIVNLCRHKDPPLSLNIVQEILPSLKYLLSFTDVTILVDSTWALAYLLDCGNPIIQLIVEFDIISDIIRLLNHNEIKIITAALRAVGNIVTGTDEQTQYVLNHGVLNYFSKLLQHSKNKINKEAVWFLSNITAGNQQQVQAVIDAQLIPNVIHHLQHSDIQTQKEAAWCISNLTMSGSVEQIQYVVNQHVIPPLCNLLQQQDAQLLQVCLDALHNILKHIPEENLEHVTREIEECGGLDKIENLQTFSNNEIYHQSYDIIEKYFSNENDDDDDDISSMSQVPRNNIFSFGNNSANQTVPDNNFNQNNPRFEF